MSKQISIRNKLHELIVELKGTTKSYSQVIGDLFLIKDKFECMKETEVSKDGRVKGLSGKKIKYLVLE